MFPHVKRGWIRAIKAIRSERAFKEGFIWWNIQVYWGEQNKPSEDEIAEAIFDWWMSGKSYNKWYAEQYMQLALDFNYE